MNDNFYEQQLYLWRDMACELREFIEYTLNLTPSEEEAYEAIIKMDEEGEE